MDEQTEAGVGKPKGVGMEGVVVSFGGSLGFGNGISFGEAGQGAQREKKGYDVFGDTHVRCSTKGATKIKSKVARRIESYSEGAINTRLL